jgi:glycosyltransferase involved in cell wall biosynthesis
MILPFYNERNKKNVQYKNYEIIIADTGSSDEEKTELKALLIRNNSIQKRFGVFFGTINICYNSNI